MKGVEQHKILQYMHSKFEKLFYINYYYNYETQISIQELWQILFIIMN